MCLYGGKHRGQDRKQGELKSSSAGTGLKAPGQQCLSRWEMHRTTVNDFSLDDGSSDLGEITFSLEKIVIGIQPDNQTSTSFASSKIVFLQMSCKLEDTKELADEENKQFNPG